MGSRVSVDAAPKRMMSCCMWIPPNNDKEWCLRAPRTLNPNATLVNTAPRHNSHPAHYSVVASSHTHWGAFRVKSIERRALFVSLLASVTERTFLRMKSEGRFGRARCHRWQCARGPRNREGSGRGGMKRLRASTVVPQRRSRPQHPTRARC